MTKRIPTDEVASRMLELQGLLLHRTLWSDEERELELLENLLESRQALGDLLQTTEEVNELRKIWDGSD